MIPTRKAEPLQRFLADKVAYTQIASSERSDEGEPEESSMSSSEEDAGEEQEEFLGDGEAPVAIDVEEGEEKSKSSSRMSSGASEEVGASKDSEQSESSVSGRNSSGLGSASSNPSSRTSKKSSDRSSRALRSARSSVQQVSGKVAAPAKEKAKAKAKGKGDKKADVGKEDSTGIQISCPAVSARQMGVVFAASFLIVFVCVVYWEICTLSEWSPWECIPLRPQPPETIGPCGLGRQTRTRTVQRGFCRNVPLVEHGNCDLGECQLIDYLTLETSRLDINCDEVHGGKLVEDASVAYGSEWTQVQDCTEAVLCCHSCGVVTTSFRGNLQCSTPTPPPVRAFFTSSGCFVCALAPRGPACEGNSTCRQMFDGFSGTLDEICCVTVARQPKEEIVITDDLSGLHLEVDHEDFVTRADTSAVLGVLNNPYEWPKEATEALCQLRCLDDASCVIYTYMDSSYSLVEWRQRCVTWDQDAAEKAGRSTPGLWIKQPGAFSGLQNDPDPTSVIVSVATAAEEGSGSAGPFLLYLCSKPSRCLEESPVDISATSCRAGTSCLSIGQTERFILPIDAPESFALHLVKIVPLTDDDWVFDQLSVAFNGEVGSHRGRVIISSKTGPWSFTVGCVTAVGEGDAEPGSPCNSTCASGRGEFGWCYTNVERTIWGECVEECRVNDEVQTFSSNTEEKSARSCADLNWPSRSAYNDDASVCSASNALPLRHCSGKVTWMGAKEFCEGVGARLCSQQELRDDEAAGTGCGYDRALVWSLTECRQGAFIVRMGKASFNGDDDEICMEATDEEARARCCADARILVIDFTKENRDRRTLPRRLSVRGGSGLSNWQVVSGINYKGQHGYFLQSGMTGNQAPYDNDYLDLVLDNVPIADKGGDIDFYFRIDSEPSADFLYFYVDGKVVESGMMFPVSGHIEWTVARFAVPSLLNNKPHTFVWRYQKDVSTSIGQDVACLDHIVVYGIVGDAY